MASLTQRHELEQAPGVGHVGVVLEQMGKVGAADADLKGHVIQRQRFHTVLGDIQAGFRHQFQVGAVRAAFRFGGIAFRMDTLPADQREEVQQVCIDLHLPEGIVFKVVPVDRFGAADDLQTFRVTRIVPDSTL